MPVVAVDTSDDPRVVGYLDMKERALRHRRGLFVVEGRETLRCLLEDSSYRPKSLLLGEPAWRVLSHLIERHAPDAPVYLASPSVLQSITGFAIHRGCLALVDRPPETGIGPLVDALPDGPSRVLVMEALTNHDNVGGLFRNAMAFGVDAAVVCPRCCDPFYRKAIRTSLGGSLCVPFARCETWPNDLARLRARGYTIVALDPSGDVRLRDLAPGVNGGRIALVVGTEGAGLSDEMRAQADVRVRIDMAPGIDSVNVATAAAIALHHFHGPAPRPSKPTGETS